MGLPELLKLSICSVWIFVLRILSFYNSSFVLLIQTDFSVFLLFCRTSCVVTNSSCCPLSELHTLPLVQSKLLALSPSPFRTPRPLFLSELHILYHVLPDLLTFPLVLSEPGQNSLRFHLSCQISLSFSRFLSELFTFFTCPVRTLQVFHLPCQVSLRFSLVLSKLFTFFTCPVRSSYVFHLSCENSLCFSLVLSDLLT